jgi:two-component system nitrate/nitrite response regulator NarL
MKLLIVDDHPVLRQGLAALLRQAGPDMHPLEASSAAEAFRLADEHADLDIVILDLIMPGMDGLQALAEFGRRRPDLPVVVLSSSEDPQDARRALSSGALGYVPKSASQHTLVAAIRLVMDGELYIPPLIMAAMDDEGVSGGAAPPARPGGADLTQRQIDVLRLLSEGHSNKAIAIRLDLSEKTVKVHVGAIFRALQVANRTQAANAGRASGLI